MFRCLWRQMYHRRVYGFVPHLKFPWNFKIFPWNLFKIPCYKNPITLPKALQTLNSLCFWWFLATKFPVFSLFNREFDGLFCSNHLTKIWIPFLNSRFSNRKISAWETQIKRPRTSLFSAVWEGPHNAKTPPIAGENRCYVILFEETKTEWLCAQSRAQISQAMLLYQRNYIVKELKKCTKSRLRSPFGF